MKNLIGTISKNSWLKSIILLIGTPVLMEVQNLIPNWTAWLTSHLGANMASIIITGLSAAITYISKEYLTNDTAAAVKVILKQGAVIMPKDGSAILPPPNAK